MRTRARAYLTAENKPPKLLSGALLTALWSWFQPPIAVTRPSTLAPSDNLQTPMNLVMPLRWSLATWRGLLAKMLNDHADEVLSGLNNVNTVHFARFDLIGRNLCMFSVYDGDFEGYIRDFIAAIGSTFDGIMRFVADPAPVPCGDNVDAFIDWVRRHDALQFPEDLTALSTDVVALRRRTLVLLHRNRNVQLGIYRGYPGYSVAQIRDGLGVGW